MSNSTMKSRVTQSMENTPNKSCPVCKGTGKVSYQREYMKVDPEGRLQPSGPFWGWDWAICGNCYKEEPKDAK